MKARLLYTLLVVLLMALPSATVFAQDEEIEELPYGLDPLSVYSIFQESYKTKDFDLALMYGIPLARIYPKAIEGIDQYSGADILDKVIDIFATLSVKQKDPIKRTALLDSSLKYFNVVFTKYTPKEIDMFNWTLRRGRFYQEHADFISGGGSKAYGDYMLLIDTDTKKIAEIGNGYYIQATLKYLVDQGERDKALKMINKVLPFADESTKSFIDKLQNQLFSDTGERIIFLEGKLAEAPKNIEILKELYELYQKDGNLGKARETAKVMYEVNPTFANSMMMATILKKNSDNKSSIVILKEALSKAKSNIDKATVYYELADTYLLLEDLQKARDNAKKAIAENGKWGQPYIKLAAIYAQAVSSCASSNMEREDKVVYWLVLDLLDKAKQVDSEVSSLVKNLYKSYLPVTPTAEEKFFKAWKAGTEIKVDKSLRSCYDWINETTTIR